MSWFKKLTNKTKLVLAIGLTVGIAALAGAAYWIYKQQISASTFTYDKCTLNASITRDPNVTPYRYVHIFNAVNYQRLKENPSSTLTSIVRMEQSNPTATVPTILNQRYYAVIHKPNGTPVLDDNASFLCHSAKTIEIYADLNSGTIRIFSGPSQTGSSATGTTASSQQKCVLDDANQPILLTLKDGKWVDSRGNEAPADYKETDLSKCTGSQAAASSAEKKCIQYGGTYKIFAKGNDGMWYPEDKSDPIPDFTAQSLPSDSTKCAATTTATDTKCVLMGSTYIWVKKNGDDWCNAKDCTVSYPDKYISSLTVDSTGAKCGSLVTSVQPAVGAPVEGKLPVPLFGGGSNFPTGNNSATFKAVRYSVAEEDPVQITLSGQGKQNFTHYTAVGGASFEITLLTAATASKNTSFQAPIAYAQDTTDNGSFEFYDQPVPISSTDSGGPINTNVVTQTECEKDSMSEDVLRQIRRLRDIRSYRISGIIPDNGTKSALTIINLPDGSYKLSIRKNGFSSCSGYFHLEGGGESYIGGIPLLAKSSSVEPPSIEAVVSKIPDKDTNLGDVYLAQKSGGRYLYSSKCIRLGWVPEGQIGAMINTPLCQKTPQISQSGETIFTDENGNPLSGPGAEAVLANILNRCGGVNLNIFGGSSGSDRMSPLEAMLLGAAGGAFGAQMSKGEIVTKDVVYPAGFALIAALTGSDINIGVGNSCIGQSLPSSNYSSLCNRCLSNPQLFYSDPNCSRCYQQSWQNQIPWDVLGRSQSLINF